MKQLLRALSVLMFSLFSVTAFPQLNGAYTIGGTSPSYATFTAAVSDLTTRGVSGPVTFNARAGTYNESAISFTAITGADSINTVTFQSESSVASDVTLKTGITFTTASFITLNSLTIGPAGIVINLLNKSNNVTISNNILNGVVVSAFGSDVIQAIGYTGTNLKICSNIINNGSEGICLYGTDNTPQNIITNAVIKNNTIQNFYGWGICANNQRGTLIEGNTVTTAPTTGYGSIPIYIQNIIYPITVVRNKIILTGANTGIAAMYVVNNHPASSSDASTIANNSISIQNGNGFELINNDYFNFYYNTVYITSSGGCFSVGGGSTGNVLADNIFYGVSGQPVVALTSGDISSSNYNDIYSTGSSLASWNGTNYSNLAAFRTASGMEAQSQSLLPSFVSATNLHLTNYVPMQFGTPIASVPDDIDGDTRRATPAVGADDNGPPYAADTNMCCSCAVPVVNPATFSGSPTSLCPGDSVTFTAQSTNGAGLKWTFPGGSPDTSSSLSPTVVYNTSGTYDVSLVLTGTGTDSIGKTGYVVVNAAASTGIITADPDSICAGSATWLMATGSSGTVQWQSFGSTGYANLTGADSIVYNSSSLTQSTNYRLVANNGLCSDTSASVAVVVNQPPASPLLSTGDSLICSSDSTLITAPNIFTSYLWNTGDTSSSISVKQAQGYWVTVTDANGCSAVSDHQQIFVYPVPSVAIDVQGDTLTSFNSKAYQWIFNDSTIVGATSNVYVAQQTGNYSVQVTDSNGCSAVSNSYPIAITNTGITELVGNTLLDIFPDPFTNTIFIKCYNAATNIDKIEIYNVLGEMILNKTVADRYAGTLSTDVSILPAGMYLVAVRANNTTYLKRMIKE